MKRALILAICLIMVASVAFAEKPAADAKFAPAQSGYGIVDRDFDEGFEVSVPPAGWTTIVTNADYTWIQGVSAYEGTYAAEVQYDPDLDPVQDEWMFFDYTLADGENHLNFAAMASYYWAVTVPNYNLFVTVNDDIVWDFRSDYATDVAYEWAIYDIDLSAYGDTLVTIGFGYQGADGAQGCFDRIGINDGYTPPPPPENDTCDGALPLPNGDFTLNVDTSLPGTNNDYDPGSGGCTGYSAVGNDLVWFTNLEVGQTLTVLMNADYDDSIYLITDCLDPVTSCVAGDDQYPSGSTFTYTATVAGTYYLIVDGYGSGAGTSVITGTNEGNVTAVDDASWTCIKALYR